MKKCCEICECYKEVEVNGKCISCNHQPKLKVVIPLNQKPPKNSGQLELFKKLHIERGNKCEWCGKVIYGFNVSNYHHIKPKGKFPRLKLEPANIVKICIPCHNKVHGH